ncbi:MAG: iron permease FTR1 [Nitrosopumilus sp.]
MKLTPLSVLFAFVLITIPNVYAQEEFDEEYVEFIMNHLDSINELLVQTDEEYSNGNKDLALKLATTAYLEHYEFIESELEQYNEELIEDVEWAMREELRGMIKNEAPASEVSAKIDEIQGKIQEIATIVPEFGLFTLMILSISLFAALVLLKKSPLLRYKF